MLETTSSAIEQIARRSGFGTPDTMNRASFAMAREFNEIAGTNLVNFDVVPEAGFGGAYHGVEFGFYLKPKKEGATK